MALLLPFYNYQWRTDTRYAKLLFLILNKSSKSLFALIFFDFMKIITIRVLEDMKIVFFLNYSVYFTLFSKGKLTKWNIGLFYIFFENIKVCFHVSEFSNNNLQLVSIDEVFHSSRPNWKTRQIDNFALSTRFPPRQWHT